MPRPQVQKWMKLYADVHSQTPAAKGRDEMIETNREKLLRALNERGARILLVPTHLNCSMFRFLCLCRTGVNGEGWHDYLPSASERYPERRSISSPVRRDLVLDSASTSD